MRRLLAPFLASEANKANPELVPHLIRTGLMTGELQEQPGPDSKTFDFTDYVNWPVSPAWYTDMEWFRFLGDNNQTAWTCTKFYYNGFDSWYGPQPFEFFIRAAYFNKLTGGAYDIDKVFKEECYFEPFLEPLIIDTLNFIMTGKRQFPVSLLLSMSRDAKAQRKEYGYEPALIVKPKFQWNQVRRLTSQELLTKWLGHHGGVSDFVNSHRIMLGS